MLGSKVPSAGFDSTSRLLGAAACGEVGSMILT